MTVVPCHEARCLIYGGPPDLKAAHLWTRDCGSIKHGVQFSTCPAPPYHRPGIDPFLLAQDMLTSVRTTYAAFAGTSRRSFDFANRSHGTDRGPHSAEKA